YRSLADDLPCFAAGGQKRIYCVPAAYEAVPCTLYHNEGRGHFRDASASSGVSAARAKSLGVTVWDYDDGGYPDVFVASDTVPSLLLHNQRNGTFQDVGLESGIAYDEDGNPHSGMGIDTGDLRNDGGLYLAITNFQHQQTSFYRKTSPTLFEDERRASNVGPATESVLGFGICFFDYDNDGYQDILQVNGHVQDDIAAREPGVSYAQPTLLLRNERDGRFSEVGLRSGAPFSQRVVGRGCAAGDFNNDGRLDALITANNGPAMLWRNATVSGNHWLTLKLVGTRSNRDGSGGLVVVRAGGLTQRALARSGSSFLSQSDLRLHFGTGAQATADVEVRWPSGAVDHVSGVACDGIRTVVEGTN